MAYMPQVKAGIKDVQVPKTSDVEKHTDNKHAKPSLSVDAYTEVDRCCSSIILLQEWVCEVCVECLYFKFPWELIFRSQSALIKVIIPLFPNRDKSVPNLALNQIFPSGKKGQKKAPIS